MIEILAVVSKITEGIKTLKDSQIEIMEDKNAMKLKPGIESVSNVVSNVLRTPVKEDSSSEKNEKE